MPKEEKKTQETHVLNSDGTTQKLVHKSKTSRTTVNQERVVKSEKVEKQEKPTPKFSKAAKVEKPGKGEKQDKPEKSEKLEKMDKATKVERSQKITKTDSSTQSEGIVKSEIVEKEEKSIGTSPEDIDKPRLGRPLTSQEESILLPLLQGLLAANASDISLKSTNENTPFRETEPSTKNSRSNTLAEHDGKGKLRFIAPILRSFNVFQSI